MPASGICTYKLHGCAVVVIRPCPDRLTVGVIAVENIVYALLTQRIIAECGFVSDACRHIHSVKDSFSVCNGAGMIQSDIQSISVCAVRL